MHDRKVTLHPIPLLWVPSSWSHRCFPCSYNSLKNDRCGGGAFNPRTQEAETEAWLSSQPAWSTERVPGQPEQHRETLSQKP
ncbi:hypothetical protein LEMLEM_LOCUS3901, partial [Lemmus lemmus]